MDPAASASPPAPGPVRRKALACLPCRAAKSACEGAPPAALAALKAGDTVEVPADAPCHRCQRLGVSCRWAPTKRIGRPAKRRRAAASGSEEDGDADAYGPEPAVSVAQQATMPAWQPPLPSGAPLPYPSTLPDARLGAWQTPVPQQQAADPVAAFLASLPPDASQSNGMPPVTAATSPLDNVMMDPAMWSILAGNAPGASPIASASGSSPDRSSSMQDFQSLHEWLPPSLPQPAVSMPDFTGAAQPPPPPPALSHRAMHQLEILQGMSSSSRGVVSSSPSRKAGANHARSSSLASMDEGLVAFFTRAQQIIPLLGTSAQYAASLGPHRTQAQMLVHHAAGALGLRLAGPRAAQAAERSLSHARQQAMQLRLPRAPAGACDSLSASEALDCMRGLLILATVEAGAGKPMDANVLLGKAARLASDWGVHRLDAPAGEEPQQQHAHLPLASAGHKWTGAAREVLEGLRRAWWELYLVDSMLWIVSSGQAGAQVGALAAQAAVDMPMDLGEEQSSNPSRQSYDSRVRACALMREALVPPTPAAARSPARLAALEALAENLLLSSDARWRTARAQAKAAEIEGDELKLQAAEARAEAALMAIVTLNSGRIHLHRNATFPEVTLDFSSCAFRPSSASHISEVSDGSASPEGGSPTPTRDPRRVADSLRRIDAASAGILDIVREDYVDRNRARHAVAAAMGGSTEDETSPLLRHTPFFACSQMVAAYGHVVLLAGTRAQAEHETALRRAGRGTVEGDEALWKRRVALSDLSLAEANTAQCAMVWPLVEGYVMQVRRCRAAVDFAGPLGLRDG